MMTMRKEVRALLMNPGSDKIEAESLGKIRLDDPSLNILSKEDIPIMMKVNDSFLKT